MAAWGEFRGVRIRPALVTSVPPVTPPNHYAKCPPSSDFSPTSVCVDELHRGRDCISGRLGRSRAIVSTMQHTAS